jgi:hypothetical protein
LPERALTILATLLHLALPPLWILAMGRFAPRRGLVWTVVAGLALYEFSLLFFGLILGYLGWLRAPGPLVFWSFVALLLIAFALRGVGPIWRAARAALFRVHSRPVDALFALAALASFYLIGIQVAHDWTVGTENFDSLAYHIPRALLWFWHGNFHPWPAATWQQVGFPVGGDVLLLPGVFLGIGWLGGAWTAAWLSLGAAAAVFAATRDLGVGRRPSLVAALAFLSFPAVGMRLVDVNSDIAAAFPLLAAWVLVARADSIAEAAFLFPVLCAVGVASKANVAPAVLVLAVALCWSRLRTVLRDRRAPAAAVAGILLAALLCLGSFLPVYRLFGDLLGGIEGRNDAVSYKSLKPPTRALLFGTLRWIIEPFALLPESRRNHLLREVVQIDRANRALGVGTDEHWYPRIDAHTNVSGVLPLVALPWLLAGLPKGRRLSGGVLFLGLLIALFAPVSANLYSPRFAVVLLGAFAVLWGVRAARSPGIVAVLVLAALIVDAIFLRAPSLRELERDGKAPDRNAHIAAAVGSHMLWVLNGALTWEARIAGRRGDVRFEYISCPRDGDWARLFAEVRGTSPWLLLNSNVESVLTGPGYSSAYGPRCPTIPVLRLQRALTAAGWRLLFEEYGYQIWSAEDRTTGEKILDQRKRQEA